jgi:organic hydroperoxide reductase OsmC/OhrA
MKHEHTATVSWASDGAALSSGKYSRAHKWRFDCGIEVVASASPSVVPLPYSREDAVDPEEVFVAAISSCHMLTFLYLASKRGIDILSYEDSAVGHMEPNENGRLAVTTVILRAKIEFAGERPAQAVLDELHHAAHEECFIANSIKTNIKIE